jgi:2-polyprenyl-3-methyl-5-hydroxy-6-metoxy-1,4-benzoquinol methylase
MDSEFLIYGVKIKTEEKGISMDRKEHWERVYNTKSHKEVSWFTEHVTVALELIGQTKINKANSIIDVGGGASTLTDDLISQGYEDITVIDISAKALEIAKFRLGREASKVNWIEADILESDFNNRKFDIWHDRAVFHFLTSEMDRNQYRDKLEKHLVKGGYVILSIFADDGPEKCSGLTIRRHGASELEQFMGSEFDLVFHSRTIHKTPSKSDQKFINTIFKRK